MRAPGDVAGAAGDLAQCLLGHRRGAPTLAQVVQEVVGIDGDAVPADARGGVVREEAVGLARGSFGDLDRVEPVCGARFGELERERDVHGAERVLVELDELGGLGRGDVVQVLAGVAQHGGGALGALGCGPAEHARGLELLVVGDSGIDALGRERNEHVLSDAQPALAERLHEQLAGGADVRRRGQHERLAGARMAHDLGAGVAQDLEVGAQLLVDGGRDADQHEVGRVERLDAIGEHEPVALEVLGEIALFGLQQLGAAATDRAEAGAGDVDPDDPAAGVAQRDRGWQADVAEADDGDDGVAGLLGAALGAARCGGLAVWCGGCASRCGGGGRD